MKKLPSKKNDKKKVVKENGRMELFDSDDESDNDDIEFNKNEEQDEEAPKKYIYFYCYCCDCYFRLDIFYNYVKSFA